MQITVRQEHIDKADDLLLGRNICKTYVAQHCPLALALKERTHKRVEIRQSGIWINHKKRKHTDDTKKFVQDYDDGFIMSPTVFEI